MYFISRLLNSGFILIIVFVLVIPKPNCHGREQCTYLWTIYVSARQVCSARTPNSRSGKTYNFQWQNNCRLISFIFFQFHRYSDITDITRSGSTITVVSLDGISYRFGMLFSAGDTHNVLQQLSKITMQQLIQDPDSTSNVDDSIINLSRLSTGNSSRKSELLRHLNTRQHSESYRAFFRLPQCEILDGQIKGKLYMLLLSRCILNHEFPVYPIYLI